jgi:hypothetical protein
MRLLIAIAVFVCLMPIDGHARYSNTSMGRLFSCMDRATKPHPRNPGARLSAIKSRCQPQRSAIIREAAASKPHCTDCALGAQMAVDEIMRIFAANPK